jgi:hypothetical protein
MGIFVGASHDRISCCSPGIANSFGLKNPATLLWVTDSWLPGVKTMSQRLEPESSIRIASMGIIALDLTGVFSWLKPRN